MKNQRAYCLRSVALLAVAIVALGGCARQTVVVDPMATLMATDSMDAQLAMAMTQLDSLGNDDARILYYAQLHKIIWVPGYRIATRREAFARLEAHDLNELKRTIRNKLPRMSAWDWRSELCEIIGDRNWIELSDGLVSSWASGAFVEDEDRPEFAALSKMHGKDQVVDVVFAALMENNKRWQVHFRSRCWTLLHRLGYRKRLLRLVADSEVPAEDHMLQDVQRSVRELGILPYNYEEILWIRKLCEPKRSEFWSQAVQATDQLPEALRGEMELRDLPIVVSAAMHDPAMLTRSREELISEIDGRLRRTSGLPSGVHYHRNDPIRFYEIADTLTWGDLAAIRVALQALAVPQVRNHLFDYARRDHKDESTEYGGVLDLDQKGRFEVIEFPPRVRHHDQRFEASQEMFDAGYTALFHFHYHVQRSYNAEYAGPGMGDIEYARQTRTNCLVLTSVRENRLNVDFYRHGGVLVDLGVIETD